MKQRDTWKLMPNKGEGRYGWNEYFGSVMYTLSYLWKYVSFK